ncbi:MAG TPA: hypothetical protein PLL30_17325 [Candidatus Krumholzibacteria bacterium]|nr:hypothetical protein [Candidatus Krumholzibacteria bacterium]HPD73538.1 hypothetical protein [Candidatus Krumholzibacteria bacterium]HRY42260.1 hypothetical protein [Candidatus Krumholzibacteria bacterium]
MPSKSRCTYRNITPASAQILLNTSNPNNRHISKVWVERLARDMKAGRWVSDVPIMLDHNGVLVDGQHRLAAVIKAGITVRMMVLSGIAADVRRVLDQNRKRTPSDVLRLDGRFERVLNHDGSVVIAMHRGLNTSYLPLTTSELVELYAENYDAIQFANSCLTFGRHSIVVVRAVVARAWYSADREEIGNFCDRLNTGAVLDKHTESGAALFYRFIMTAHVTGTVGQYEVYAKCERALRAFIDKEKIARLYETQVELFPLPGETE